MKRASVLSILVGACTLPASAQEALFLLPERAEIPLGARVSLSAAVGADAAAPALPWPHGRIEHFFARTATTQENRDTLEPVEGLDTVSAWPADHAGVLLLGIDLEPALETVTAEAFGAFVSRAVGEAGLAAVGELPEAGEVRILHTESSKALVRVAAPGETPPSIATSKTGQTVEIRPLMDPTAIVPGSDLAVRLYAKIPGAAGGVVIATNATTGETVRALADESGIAAVHVPSAGRWRMEFHAVGANQAEDAEASWVVHSATLTFDVVEEDPQ